MTGKKSRAGMFSRLKKEKPPRESRPHCTALVPAAGLSSRMEGGDKLLMELNGQPVLIHTLRALELCPEVDEVIVAVQEEQIMAVGALARAYGLSKVTKVVAGGKSRTETVRLALAAASRETVLAAVHDGARPLAGPALIGRVIRMAAHANAAIAAVPVKDTIKVVENGHISRTPDRKTLWAAQTPQVFARELLDAALSRAAAMQLAYSDDAGAVEDLGVCVYICQGEYENLKITTPEDLRAAQAILDAREELP